MKLPFCLTLAVLGVIGCTDDSASLPADAQSAPLTSSTASSQADHSQSFGDFSFLIPDGWTVVTPDRDKTKAMILLDGTNWQNAKAMIKVDVGAPTAPTAKQLAEAFAKNTGGNVSADALDFDGTPGVVASTSSKDLTVPRSMIVVFRDGKAYLLMAGATADIDISNAVSTVRESWKWAPNAR